MILPWALHAELEGVGFNKSRKGVWDLDTYANWRDRAQTLESPNDEKDSANRTLKYEIDGLKQKMHPDAKPYHEQRIASTMLAKKAVWERSTGHIVDTYAQCPCVKGGMVGRSTHSSTPGATNRAAISGTRSPII